MDDTKCSDAGASDREAVSYRADARDWIVAGLLALLVTAVFADVLFGSRIFFSRDVLSFYYPTKKIIHDIVRQGSFPYWNPHYDAGQPMAANPEYEIFYPLQWLIFLRNFLLGFRLHVLVHVYLAVIGTFLFLRSLALRRVTSAIGAISYGLGGVVVSVTCLLPLLFPLAWVPFIARYARAYFKWHSPRDLGLASLATGMVVLIGEPTSLAQTFFVLIAASVAIELAGASAAATFRRVITAGGRAFLVIGIALLIGAVQLIPTIDFARDSVRSWVFAYPLVVSWSLPPVRILEMFHPGLFGRYFDVARWYWGGALYDTGSPYIWSLYPGLLVAAFSLAALFTKLRGRALFTFVAISSFVLAIGEHTPLYRVLYAAALVRHLRYPEKFIMMGIAASVVMGCIAIDRFLDGDRKLSAIAQRVVLVLFFLALAGAVFTMLPAYDGAFRYQFGLPDSPVTSFELELSRMEWWKELGRAAVLVLVIALGMTPRRRPFAAALALAFTALDVIPVAREAAPALPRQLLETPRLPAAAGMRLFNEGEWDYTKPSARPFPVRGEAYYWVVRNGLFTKVAVLSGIDPVLGTDYDLTDLVATTRLLRVMTSLRSRLPRWPQPFLTMADAPVRGLLRNPLREVKRVDGDWQRIAPVEFVRGSTAGRLYFAERVVPVRSDDEVIDALVNGQVPDRVAFVASPVRADGTTGTVRVVSDSPNETSVDVSVARDAFLVRSVTPHRYWNAMIDGRAAEIIPTNIAFQGIGVPAGRHQIVFRYRNPIVLPSAIISFFAILGSIFLVLRRNIGNRSS